MIFSQEQALDAPLRSLAYSIISTTTTGINLYNSSCHHLNHNCQMPPIFYHYRLQSTVVSFSHIHHIPQEHGACCACTPCRGIGHRERSICSGWMSLSTGLHTVSQRSKKHAWRIAVAAAISFSFTIPCIISIIIVLILQRQKSVKNRRHTTITPSGCQLAYSPPTFSCTLQDNKEGGYSPPSTTCSARLLLAERVRA